MIKHYKYLIIGGGLTGDAAVKGIRELDSDGTIVMVSAEANPPYSRPPLSKDLWKGKDEAKIWKKTSEQGVDIRLNTRVKKIDPMAKSVTIETGDKLLYDRLLLATGAVTNKFPFGGEDVIYYRTYDDYKKLRELTKEKDNIVVIGGGFIGSEIAAAMAMNGKKVTMIFPAAGIGDTIFPAELSSFITDYYKAKGVQIMNSNTVVAMKNKNGAFELTTGKEAKVGADIVIGGIGVRPDTALAEASGVMVNNGIMVDEFLRTSQPSIFAAGDAANFYNPALDKRIRVEHEDNALKMGKQAGRVMAGSEEPYHHLPFFYSDMFELGYEAVGELNSEMHIYADWKEKFKEGVIYYMSEQRVRGVLLWNVWGQVDEARKIIAEKGPFIPDDLKGRLPVKKEK